jgi:hypothetical protein
MDKKPWGDRILAVEYSKKKVSISTVAQRMFLFEIGVFWDKTIPRTNSANNFREHLRQPANILHERQTNQIGNKHNYQIHTKQNLQTNSKMIGFKHRTVSYEQNSQIKLRKHRTVSQEQKSQIKLPEQN